MSNLLKENHLLLAVLIGGSLFMVAAVVLLGLLVLLPPTTKPTTIAANTLPAEAPLTPSPSSHLITSAPPSLTPTLTPSPTATPTLKPISATGDKLSLPTATSTPSPTSTPAATPTPTSIPQPVEGLHVGNIAPDFTLGSNRASRVSLSGLRGKVVILNFWASWCPYCAHEVPALQAIHNEYGPQGVVVLAINEREKLENVERFAHDNGVSFAVWLDEDGWAGEIYQVRSIPTTYFIDAEGIIRTVQIGSITKEQVLAHLEKLL